MTSNFNQWHKFISGPRKLKKLHEQCHKYETQIEHLEKTISELNTALLNKAAPDPRVAVWTPIASAKPQAGKHALLLCKNGRGKEYIIIGQWIPRFFEDNCDSDNAEYCEEKDEYYAPEGWYESIHNWDECTSVQVNDTVTHWMELAPLIAAQRGEG